MRKILCLAVLVAFALGPTVGTADSAGTMIERFGLSGTWASECAVDVIATRPGFRIIFGQSGSQPTYTTISADGGVRMTIRSAVMDALPLGGSRLKLQLQIIGGERDGGALPSPTTNRFEQTIEKLGADRIRLTGAAPQLLQRCRN
jgi:hypothetical protein